MFLNLFVAIILEGFEDTQTTDKQLLNFETTEYFRDVWSRFDPKATGLIHIKDFKKFMLKLQPPIGWDESYRNNKRKQKFFVRGINLRTFDNFKKYQFMNVLENLALNMIVTKEVEELIQSQGKNQKTNE